MRSPGAPSVLALALVLSLPGCRREDSGDRGADPAARAPGAAEGGIPWIRDDYAAALARARERDEPLVVDLWAPWCHTCLSMKHYVLPDQGLRTLAGRFVWLSLDTDREENAAVLEKLPIDSWPTFYVLSPVDESVQARHVGAASVAQFREFLIQGEKGHLEAKAAAGKLTRNSVLWHLREGDRAAAAGSHAAAARAYRQALEAAPPDYVRLPDMMVHLVGALRNQGDHAGCVEFAFDHGARVTAGRTAAAADFASIAGECAAALEGDPRQRALLDRMAALVADVAGAEDAALSLDDRSEALRVLRKLAEARQEPEAARRHAVAQRELLDRAVAEAPTAHAEMTYAGPRAEVYAHLGALEEVVPWLEELVEKIPTEYDPPYRLAWARLELGQHDEALAAADRALNLVYGPRTARVHALIADVHRARGDRDAELAARRAAVETLEKLPAGQRNPAALERARKALAEPAE